MWAVLLYLRAQLHQMPPLPIHFWSCPGLCGSLPFLCPGFSDLHSCCWLLASRELLGNLSRVTAPAAWPGSPHLPLSSGFRAPHQPPCKLSAASSLHSCCSSGEGAVWSTWFQSCPRVSPTFTCSPEASSSPGVTPSRPLSSIPVRAHLEQDRERASLSVHLKGHQSPVHCPSMAPAEGQVQTGLQESPEWERLRQRQRSLLFSLCALFPSVDFAPRLGQGTWAVRCSRPAGGCTAGSRMSLSWAVCGE